MLTHRKGKLRPVSLLRSLRRRLVRLPLRLALTLPFVLLIVGATTLVGYLSYGSGQAAVENLGHQLVTQTNEQVTQELKNYLQMPLLVNRLNVGLVDQGYLDPQNVSALETALFNRLRQFEQISTVMFLSPQGRVRFVERFPGFYLGVAEPARPDYLQIYPLNDQGKRGPLAHEVNGLDLRRDRFFYQQAVTTGQSGWSPITRYGNSNALTLNAAQPVYNSSQRLLGVFAVHLRLDYLSQFLRRLAISRAGQVIITDQNGALIATSTDEQPYSFGDKIKQPNQFYQFRIDQSQNDLTRSLGEYLRDRSGTLSSVSQPQRLQFRHRGELHYIQITPFQDEYGLNWRVIAVIPRSYFLAEIEDGTHITIMLCLLTLSGAIGLGLIAADRLTTRFAQLNRVSREFAAGHLNQRLPTNGSIRELNGLAHTFNQMADQIQHSFDAIKTALAESEEKFTTIFRLSPEPIAIANREEGRFLEVNDSATQFLGYSTAEIVGSSALELNLWLDLAQRQQYLTQMAQENSVRNLEVQIRTKAGEAKTILLSAEGCTLEGKERVIVMHRDISDRKAVELALQQSEARYRAIVEDQTELICRFLPDTTLTFVNDAYCRYFGLSRAAAIGKSYSPLIYEPDQAEVGRQISSMSISNPVVMMQNRVVVNGEVRWMQWSNRLLFDAQGNAIETQAVGRDITEIKHTEQALQEREAMLRAIGDNLPKGYIYQCTYEPGKGSRYSYISAGIERLLGLKPEDVLRDSSLLRTIGFEEDLANAREVMQQAIAAQIPFELQMRNRAIPGKIQWSSIRETPRRLADGRLVWDGVEIDITDLKQIEAALRESEERFRRAFDDAPIGISLVSPTGQFVKVNRSYCSLLGYTEAELLALTFSEISHPADRAADWQGFEQMLSGEIPAFQMQKRFMTRQGSAIPVLLNAAPIRDEAGNVLYVVGHIQDIRDRLKVERMKHEFVSIVSHELRTPLTSIRGALGILGSGVFNDRPQQAQKMLKIAINNSDRLVRLVNDILTLERLESGKAPMLIEPCQVADLMQQAIDSVQTLADQSGITLTITPLTATLWAASDGIVQTLTNLLSNAIKFSPPGGTVWLKAELGQGSGEAGEQGSRGAGEQGSREQTESAIVPSSPPPDAQCPMPDASPSDARCPMPNAPPPLHPSTPYLQFTVRDRGRGIPADKLGIIFEQFQQVDASDSRKKGGTGLGLAICRKIVQEHGGQIWAESRLGEGSTFCFTLPLRQ